MGRLLSIGDGEELLSWPYNSAKPRAWVPVEHFPATESVFCVNCGEVVRIRDGDNRFTTNGHCLACGSRSILPLMRVIAGLKTSEAKIKP